MTRILSIGAELDLATKSALWGEDYNAKDYDIVFIDLLGLDQLVGDKNVVDVEEADGADLPHRGDIAQLLKTGGDVVATLPSRSSVSYSTASYGGRDLGLIKWVPTRISFTNEEGISVDNESIDEDWEWYFNGNFQWETLISAGGEAYGSGNYCESSPVVKNGYDETLATNLIFYTQSDGSANMSVWPGSIYLVPLLNEWSYDDFCRNVLNRVLSEDVELIDDTKPEWIDDYQFPGEETHQDEIQGIESKIQSLQEDLSKAEERLENIQEFKGLLFDSGTSLEDIAHRSLRELGLEVEGERPHRRDGAIVFDDTTIILEIHGTTRGIPRSKCEQLDTWVSDNQREDPTGSYEGLFIVNPFRKEKPDERHGYLDPDTEAYMENRGHKILTTDCLYRILVRFKQGDMVTEDVRELIMDNETVMDCSPPQEET